MINRGHPYFAIEGGLYPGQSGMHTTLPWVKPTPPWLPVPHRVQLKFLVGNNLQPPGPLPLPILPISNGQHSTYPNPVA